MNSQVCLVVNVGGQLMWTFIPRDSIDKVSKLLTDRITELENDKKDGLMFINNLHFKTRSVVAWNIQEIQQSSSDRLADAQEKIAKTVKDSLGGGEDWKSE